MRRPERRASGCRIPRIAGNSRQTIVMQWGNADAESQSNATAVFNESNGYLSVWHMGDDGAGSSGHARVAGHGHDGDQPAWSAAARHLAGGQGVFGGDKIPNYPSGSSPHSTESLVPRRKAERDGHGLGQRAGAGQGGDAVSQPASREHGLLLFRRQRGGPQHDPHESMGPGGAHVSSRTSLASM